MATAPSSMLTSRIVEFGDEAKEFIRNELEDQIGHMLNTVQGLLREHLKNILDAIQSLANDSDHQWHLHKPIICKGNPGDASS